jgi:glutaredoxin
VLGPLGAPSDAAVSAAPREVSVQVPKSVLLLPLIAAGLYVLVFASTEMVALTSPSAEPTVQPARRAAPVADRRAPLDDGQRAPRPGLPPLVIEELSAPERRPLGGTDQQSATSGAAQADVSSSRALAQSRRDAEARELATMRERVDINVYYTTWCPACRSLRGYLAERGIRATEYDIENNPAARLRQRQLNPRGSIPTVDIEGQVLVGFNAKSIEAAIDRAARARLQRL